MVATPTQNALADIRKNLLKTKKIDRALTLNQWFVVLDNLTEALRQKKKNRRIWAIILLVPIIGLGYGLYDDLLVEEVAVPILIVLTIIAIVLILPISGHLNQIKNFVKPFLSALAEDSALNSPVHLKLDLGDSCHKSRACSPWCTMPFEPRTTYTFYKHPWFSGAVTLVDDTLVEWSVEDYVIERRRKKVSASGKYKVKIKRKVKRQMSVMVTARAKDYEVAQSQAWLPGESVRVSSSENKVKFKAEGVDKIEYGGDTPPDMLFALVASAFERLQPRTKKEEVSHA